MLTAEISESDYTEDELDSLLDLASSSEGEDQELYMSMYEAGDLRRRMSSCRRCLVRKGCKNVVPWSGPTKGTLVCFLGEAPGETEDELCRPFVGDAGELLEGILAAHGINRKNIPFVNLISCRPPKNRDPAPHEVEACSTWVNEQIELIDPLIVFGLGRFSMAAMRSASSLKYHHGKFFEIGPGRPGAGRIGMFSYHPAGCFAKRDPTRERYNALDSDIGRLAQIALCVETFGARFALNAKTLVAMGEYGSTQEAIEEAFL